MEPDDSSTAWGFGQLASGSAATSWTIAGAAITSPGGPLLLAPVASAATDIGTDQFTANWSAASPAATGPAAATTTYEIDVATDSAFTSFVSGYQATNVGSATSTSVTGLSAGTAYYYRVRAKGPLPSASSNTIYGDHARRAELHPDRQP